MQQTLDIEDLAPGGEGVARAADGRAVFVPFTAPGDRVVADVPAGPGPAHASLVSVSEAGRSRVVPPCRHFGPGERRRCGGCEWLHLGYDAQLAAKERAFVETLRRIGKLEPDRYELRPIVASPSPLRYRSRAKFHLDRRSGRLVFFRRRSHEAVELRECWLLEEELDALREAVGPALVAANVDAREVTLEWSRHARRGAAHLQLQTLSPSAVTRAEAFLAAVPSLAGAILTADGAPTMAVGDPVLLHARRPADPAAGLQRSRPDVFQQANRGANALLVQATLDLVRPDGADVLELFCGAGNFTGPLAARARAVAAVEVQGPALELARQDLGNASVGGAGGGSPGASAGQGGAGSGPTLSSVRFFGGDSLAVARAFAREKGPQARRFDAVLLDPPREGARGLGPALRDLGVRRAVYVSCDPATLARDVRGCIDAGFHVEVVQPVDMFPQTHHVEGIVSLRRGWCA